MKDFDNDDQNQTMDKTITIPSIKKEVLLMLCVLASTLDLYGPRIAIGAKGNCTAPTAL